MSRPVPMEIQVRDALVRNLKLIGRDSPGNWRTKPLTVKALRTARDFEEARPCLVVQIGEWSDEPQMSGIHRRTQAFLVGCINASTLDPMGALANLVSDVVCAVTNDETLGTLLQSGWIRPARGAPEVEFAEGKAGIGYCVVELEAQWEWKHGEF